jgi:hypothetical protein
MATAEFNNRSQQWTVDKHILARWSSFKRFDFIAAGSMTFIGGNDSERVRTEYGDDVLKGGQETTSWTAVPHSTPPTAEKVPTAATPISTITVN